MPRRTASGAAPTTTRSIPTRSALDMGTVEPSLAGPKRPQDRVALKDAAREFVEVVKQHRDNVGYRSEVRWDGEGGAPEPRDVPGHHEGQNGKDRWVKVEGERLPHPRRQRGDRGDHLLHQHLEPLRDDRRRAGRAEGAGAGAEPQAVGQDLAGAGQPGGQRLSRGRRGCTEDLDALGFNLVGYGCTTCIGNSGPLAGADLQGDRRRRPRRLPRCCRATATSRGGSIRTCGRTISPRRRWSSPTRSPAT